MRNDVQQALMYVESEAENREARVHFRFDSSLPIFTGHFPGNPLLPGALQIEMVRTASENVFGVSQKISSIYSAKFKRKILPDEVIVVHLTTQDAGEGTLTRATLNVDGEVASLISLVVEPENDKGADR